MCSSDLEIEHELLPGQTAADQPDLVARVFQMKKKALIKAIVNDGILEPVQQPESGKNLIRFFSDSCDSV